MNILDPIAVTIISVLCLQAVVFGILLVVKHKENNANLMLSLLLFFFVLAASNLALFHILSLFDQTNLIPFLQLELLFGLGPALYLYAKNASDPSNRLSIKNYILFIPALLEFIYYRTPFFRDGSYSLFQTPVSIENIIYSAIQWGGIIWTSVFIVLSLRILIDYQQWVKNNFSNLSQKNLSWLQKLVLAYAIFWFLWLGIRLSDMFIFNEAYRNFYYYPMFIILSLITCWIGFQGYMKHHIEAFGFSKESKPINQKSPSPSSDSVKKQVEHIKNYMESEKPYLDPNLNLNALAEKTEIHHKQLSMVINKGLGMNFHEFVNQYRVEEFKNRIKSPDHDKLTLLGHSFDSGFGSKSTFNHIFKKHTQLTPRQYYQQIHSNES